MFEIIRSHSTYLRRWTQGHLRATTTSETMTATADPQPPIPTPPLTSQRTTTFWRNRNRGRTSREALLPSPPRSRRSIWGTSHRRGFGEGVTRRSRRRSERAATATTVVLKRKGGGLGGVGGWTMWVELGKVSGTWEILREMLCREREDGDDDVVKVSWRRKWW